MTRARTPLISAENLQTALADPASAPTLLDVRWVLGGPSQRPSYDEGHIPGAVWIEFEDVVTGKPGKHGRHPMPDRARFEATMRAAGVGDEHSVVVYDAANSLAASRLWWLLRAFGHPCVRVLDGGYAAWVAAGGPVTTEVPQPREGDFIADDSADDLLDADDAAEYAMRHLLLDARPADRFHGRNETMDPVAGHIPGARSMPALSNVTETGHFLPADDLALRFTAAGIQPEGVVGLYCGSGVQATHLALAMEAAGLHPHAGVYIGSWSHWITDPDRPVAVD